MSPGPLGQTHQRRIKIPRYRQKKRGQCSAGPSVLRLRRGKYHYGVGADNCGMVFVFHFGE